jgi:hypothetical protein
MTTIVADRWAKWSLIDSAGRFGLKYPKVGMFNRFSESLKTRLRGEYGTRWAGSSQDWAQNMPEFMAL